jgi:hypothetical protein
MEKLFWFNLIDMFNRWKNEFKEYIRRLITCRRYEPLSQQTNRIRR